MGSFWREREKEKRETEKSDDSCFASREIRERKRERTEMRVSKIETNPGRRSHRHYHGPL